MADSSHRPQCTDTVNISPLAGDDLGSVPSKGSEHQLPLPLIFTAFEYPLDHPACQSEDDEDSPIVLPSSDITSHGISYKELAVLSSREYSIRASDPEDFPSAWETLIPALEAFLGDRCNGDFNVNVFSFPERSSIAVPRVIFITSTDALSATVEHEIGSKLGRLIPPKFRPVYLRFGQGGIERSGWWGRDRGERNSVCEPQNITYREFPMIGMSIGPVGVRHAASLGGFVKIGAHLFALTAFHPFEDCRKSGDNRVSHPAGPDLETNRLQDPGAKSYNLGAVSIFAPPGKLRPSLTFRGMHIPAHHRNVELDYCAIGPVPEGKNIVAIPAFDKDRLVTVEKETGVMGNTEVYCLARTSGYSLGLTSDVPGLQRIEGELRREWTVRQYAPAKCSGRGRSLERSQTTKQWITSGIGVPGDSGAWLIRRSDNAVMGLIWGRNYDYGSLTQRVRLTYFTPIVDIISDLRQKVLDSKEDVTIPSCSGEVLRDTESRDQQGSVGLNIDNEPWSTYASDSLRQLREEQERVIRTSFDSDVVPRFGSVFDGRPRLADRGFAPAQGTRRSQLTNFGQYGDVSPQDNEAQRDGSISTWKSREKLLLGINHHGGPSVPGLSRSSSVDSLSNSQVGLPDYEENTATDMVQILGEEIDENDVDVIEPIRAKAVFNSPNTGQSGSIRAASEKLLVC